MRTAQTLKMRTNCDRNLVATSFSAVSEVRKSRSRVPSRFSLLIASAVISGVRIARRRTVAMCTALNILCPALKPLPSLLSVTHRTAIPMNPTATRKR
jgi:hypothetical protein